MICLPSTAKKAGRWSEFEKTAGAFVVKFLRRPAAGGGINEGVSEGINGGLTGGASGGVAQGVDRLTDYIRNSPGRNVKQIAAALNLPQRTVERWLKKLKEQGRIVFTGSPKAGGYFAAE